MSPDSAEKPGRTVKTGEKISIRYLIKNPAAQGLPCTMAGWRERQIEPHKIRLNISPAIEDNDERRIYISFQSHGFWSEELELLNFQIPDMGDETFVSLSAVGGCNAG